jgi:hypothetical protein
MRTRIDFNSEYLGRISDNTLQNQVKARVWDIKMTLKDNRQYGNEETYGIERHASQLERLYAEIERRAEFIR